jgi:DNA-binding FadR family transcriptional regulator
MSAVARLAGNPTLELFVVVLYQFGLSETRQRLYSGRPDRVAQWIELRRRMFTAIMEGEPEIAATLNGRSSGLLSSWMHEPEE